MFSQTKMPARDKDGFILAKEYQHLLQKKIDNHLVEVTTVGSTDTIPLYDLLGNAGFVLAFQPGASTKDEADNKLYSQKPGAVGCGGELIELDKVTLKLAQLGYKKVVIISTKSSAQQQQVFKEKKPELPHSSIVLISDPEGKLAKSLGLFLSTDRVLHPATQEPLDINFIERIRILGHNHTIEGFYQQAAGETPAANVKRMVTDMCNKKMNSALGSSFNLTDFAAESIGFNPATTQVPLPFFNGASRPTNSPFNLTDFAAQNLDDESMARNKL
jgi:peroxiredoxin